MTGGDDVLDRLACGLNTGMHVIDGVWRPGGVTEGEWTWTRLLFAECVACGEWLARWCWRPGDGESLAGGCWMSASETTLHRDQWISLHKARQALDCYTGHCEASREDHDGYTYRPLPDGPEAVRINDDSDERTDGWYWEI